ncbi:aminotransferase [Amnibacterium kyonggiense]|uniref:aminotransferase n=1 Tax=Amnibacterium kyonggiense TaxID=595671 RepID=UPI001FE60782|nr:aminotransferase [Amnibacterium kyonggiense]
MPTAFDFFAAGELPAPDLPLAEAAAIADALGVPGDLESLGSQQDQNLLIRGADGPLGVLKLANAAFPEREIAAQEVAAAAVQAAAPDLRIATVLEVGGRPASGRFPSADGELTARVLRFLPGGTLVGRGHLGPDVVARMGSIAGRVSAALADFEHPGLDRVLQWDLRESRRVVDLLGHPDADRHDAIRRATDEAWGAVQRVAGDLPVQAGHWDLTDDNLVVGADGRLPDGIIDFGDVARGWRVGELAVALSCLLHHPGGDPWTALPAVRAFDAVAPLSDAEIAALWPLVQLRGAVLVVSGAQQVALDAANDYAASALDREWRMFSGAVGVPAVVMTALIRDALGRPRRLPTPRGRLATAAPIDLGVTSPLADDGAWLEARFEDLAAASAHEPVAAPAGVARIGSTRPLDAAGVPSVPTAATLWAGPEPLVLAAPWTGAVRDGALHGAGLRLLLAGAAPEDGPRQEGDELVVLPPGGRVDVQLVADDAPAVPLLVRRELAPGWLALVADPGPLLGLPLTEPEDDAALLRRRDAALADVQEHYWSAPPRIERGWGVHLVESRGRVLLDMVNNVTAIGHAHPAVTAAVARQLGLLNTNSRFHYRAITDLATTLAGLLPDPLDRVLLVNSGSEAVDLAIRVAHAATGRTGIVAVGEAYHGWTLASDAVSTSIADNPNAIGTRPDWVHVVDAPNAYRGRHRDAEARRYGPEAAAAIRALPSPPAAFLAEPFFGNAGGVPLPDGYLREVYSAVRERGGLAIADEVQVGLGRLGRWFWGFEQQGVVPDVVTVAKSLGNGFPVGAVITTADVARRFGSEGSFFSSTGGSPVSSVAASTVLRVLREEGLQERARVVGDRLRTALEGLAARHGIIGAVHGAGLYLGVELVRDRATRTPATVEAAAICDRLLTRGVVVQPTGDHKNVLKIKPPLVLPEDAADFFVAQLDEVLATGW